MPLYYPCKCKCECHKVSLSNRRNYASVSYTPYRINSNRQVLKINMLICLDQNVTNIIPKIGSPLWNDLNSRNMIKRNIEISTRSSSAQIYDLIHHLFPNHLNGQRLCLFNSSSGILKEVSYNEITCDLIKRNLTKTKKMYIAPGAIGIPETYYVPGVIDITNAFDIPDVTDAFDFPDASNFTDAFDVLDALDVLDTSGVTNAFDVLDAFNVPDAFFPDAFNVTGAFDNSDVIPMLPII
ncbi:uncharacterized protein OCT59_005459 [Rhizophagus irregularis]|uniref:Uncharacterized protein n=4 Tax=Rhizophagus irregularis TaxID=588596 RepID=A0A015LX51_RHIIW|nr:hypothetical protein RirG_025350 [Rhizophagus irregularis DAOM 197198w]UZO13987.1 hypothetical protein OCT59_005459 [Rhizophagus irregularis]